MGSGVVPVDSAAENGDGRPAGFERATVRLRVHASRHPAHDDEARRRKLTRELLATWRPYDEHDRAPTIATDGSPSSCSPAAPRRKRPGGGSWSSRTRRGKHSADRPTKRYAAFLQLARYADSSNARSNRLNRTSFGSRTT